MSRSNAPAPAVNPATRFFEWSGSAGKLRYYDKDAKKQMFVDLPFTFLVLDRLHTTTGFDDKSGSGFWSNEVRDISRETLIVRNKGGVVATGVWKQLPALTGLKYAQSVYVAFKDENGTLVLGNLKASGCFVSAWIEFTKKRNLYEGAITVTGATEERKGATQYYAPTFAPRAIAPETDAQAKALDITLQEYLTAYFQRGREALAATARYAATPTSPGPPTAPRLALAEAPFAPFVATEPPDNWHAGETYWPDEESPWPDAKENFDTYGTH